MATLANLVVKISTDQKALKKGLTEARKRIGQLETKLASAGNASKKATRAMGRGFNNVADTINNKTKVAVLALGAAITLIAKQTLTLGRDFSAAIGDLSAITGAVGADLESLKQKALELGQTTTLTATQVAKGAALMASAKPDLLTNIPALNAVTAEMLKLAEASGTDLAAAAITLGSSLNQFSADAAEAGRFINVLAAGSKLGASLVPQTAAALEDAGVVAHSAGLSFEETNAAIQTLSLVSIKGGKAGIALKNILLTLQTQTDDKINPAIVGLTAAFQELQDRNLSAADALAIFDKRSITAARTLIKNVDITEKLTIGLTGTNIAYEQAAIKAGTYDGKVKSLSSAFEGLQLAIFARAEPALTALVVRFTELSRNAIDSVKPVSDFIALVGKAGLMTAAALGAAALGALAIKAGLATGALLLTRVAVLSLQTSFSILAGALFLGFQIGERLDSEFKIARDAGAIFFNFVGKSVAQLVFIFQSLGAIIGDAFVGGFKFAIVAIEKSLSILGSSFSAFGLDTLAQKAFDATKVLSDFGGGLGGGLGTKLRGFRETRDTQFANIDDATVSALRRDTDTVTVGLVVPEKTTQDITKAVSDGVKEGFIGFNQLLTLGGGGGTFSTVGAQGSGGGSSSGFGGSGRADQLNKAAAEIRFGRLQQAAPKIENNITLQLDGEILATKTVETDAFAQAFEALQQKALEDIRRGVD